MKRGGPWWMVAALALVLGLGVAGLYRARIGRGDVFPEYSSLRADPLGTRALHDAAGLLPGRRVERWLRPLVRLGAGPGDVVFVVGLDRARGHVDEDEWRALDALAIGGAQVVVAWRAELAQSGDGAAATKIRLNPWTEEAPETEEVKKTHEEREKADAKDGKDEKAKREGRGGGPQAEAESPPPEFASAAERRWGVRLLRRELVNRVNTPDAQRGEDAAVTWPETLARWRSDLFFLPREEDGWRVRYRRGAEPVLIDRKRGQGGVTLLADSFMLSNEAVQRERATPVLAALLGDARRVVFVESHLGVEQESGVAVLARRYGLGGACLMAMMLAGLWIWRRASPLAPTIPEEQEIRLTLVPTAGLEALLRRAVPPGKLYATCLDEWRAAASPAEQRKLAASPPMQDTEPVSKYNATTRLLSRKTI